MASRVLRAFSRLYLNTSTILHHAPVHPSSTAIRCLSSLHPPAPLLPPLRPTYQPQRHMSRPRYTRPYFIDTVMLNLKLFDKINPEKLTLDSHFHKDLGLDSLDHVEIVMFIEDEFGFEIPDMDAQRLLSPRDFVNYLCDKYDIYDGWEKGEGATKRVDEAHGKHSECPPEDPWEKAGMGKSHV